jgi:4-hydroxy-4-methyl-2-oxoglutarate aldolase
VRPGDLVAADGDGVLVIPAELLAMAVDGAEQRVQREAEDAALIAAGRSLFEVHDLETAYRQSGVQEIDGYWDQPDSQ